jgi:pyruvate dehydrogenase E2 component (dihydrolipoamide acetyltransferase)
MQFKLPELGEGVHEGELTKWRVKPGDQVKFDQPLCEIMTDKATVEIPSAFQGKVAELHVKEGDVVHVDQLMCSFEGALAAGAQASGGAHAAAPAAAAPAASAPAQAAAKSAPASQPQAPASSAAPQTAARGNGQSGAMAAGGATHIPSAAQAAFDTSPATRVLAAPSTRRAAREMGVDLGQVTGSGPHGRVLREDLEKGARSGGTAPQGQARKSGVPSGGEERVAFRGLRKKIAEKMRQSKDHAAHFTYVEECDMTNLVALRSQAKEIGTKQGIKVTYLPFIMKGMVAALKQYPILNSTLDEEKQEIVFKHYYNIALSVQTDDGLMAPVIKDIGNKSILEIAKDIEEVVGRARNKKLTMDDLTGGTITLTNAGTIGGLFATPVINYPEVAILGFNKIFRHAAVKQIEGKEQIVIRDWTYFSLSLDHRIVDGAIGAEFMKLLVQYIENPSLMLLS